MERLRCGDGQKSKAGGELGGQTWLTGTNAESQSKSVGSDDTERDRLVSNDVSVSIWWKREATTQNWRERRWLRWTRFASDFSITSNIT